MKVAFHAINGVGLGHLVRAVTLATEMRELVPDIELLVLTNARDTSMLRDAGLDYVQFPPRLDEPHADPLRIKTALPPMIEQAAFIATLDTFAPDLVVFDTHAPTSFVAHVSKRYRAVLVLRELRPEALRSFAASKIARLFDRIIIPQEAGDMDLSALAHLPAVRVGPIVRRVDRRTPRAIRPMLVVAMAGGGGQPVDARRYVRAVADAHHLARARFPALETVLVTGPYGDAPPNAAAYDGLTVVRSHPDMTGLLSEAAVVVSQAGYNAVAEIRALERPAILVPGYRKAEDQRARAGRLVRAKAAVLARPEARSIADRLEALLADPGALASMRVAHAEFRLVPKNREAAEAVLRPAWAPRANAIRSVVLVAHDFAPKHGGMETVAGSLAANLQERGIEVHVYTTARLGVMARQGAVVEPLYTPLPPPGRIDLERDLSLTIDRAIQHAPDVIHLCNAGLGPWVPALKAALPSIVTANVHGNDLLSPWVFSERAPEKLRQAQVEGLSSADAVLCVSEYSQRRARELGVAASVLHTIENGVDPARFCPGPRSVDLAQRLAIDDGDEIVLTVSRLAPRKGHRTVLQSIARLAAKRPRLKFVFTGTGNVMRSELQQLASELGIASRIVPVGFVSNDDLPDLYRLANVFALLSSESWDDVEGFGVALLEAAATGLPTLTSGTGGMAEAMADGVTGLVVPPDDPELTARALDRLLEDRAVTHALGARGRERVIAHFSRKRTTDRTIELWSSLLAERDRRPLGSEDGVELLRHAQRHGAERAAVRAARREAFRKTAASGRPVGLRATGQGARLLPQALDDCAAEGIAPRVEVKLSRFVEPDFLAYALPLASDVDLVHGVPHPNADALLATLRAMPPEALAKVRLLRLFLSAEAAERPSTAVPEAHALRRHFSEGGATVVPPPELMRYLSELPAGGPETGMIEPTNLCNLACPTCPTGTGKIKPLPQMTIERFDHVIEQVAPRMRNIALWNYGEPLLNRQLPQMIAHAKRAGVGVVKVSSNVHFLDGERGSAILQSGLDVLILSVDGATAETYGKFRQEGDFDRVGKAVAWLCSEKKRLGLTKPRIELQFIAMSHNEHELPEIRRLAREWGVDRFRVKTVGADDPKTRDLVPKERLLSRYREDRESPSVRYAFCTMAWDHTVVNVDGSVTPCCYLRPDMGDEFVMGNIFESSFAQIWRGERYRAFRASMLDGRESMPVCNRCRGSTQDLLASEPEELS